MGILVVRSVGWPELVLLRWQKPLIRDPRPLNNETFGECLARFQRVAIRSCVFELTHVEACQAQTTVL